MHCIYLFIFSANKYKDSFPGATCTGSYSCSCSRNGHSVRLLLPILSLFSYLIEYLFQEVPLRSIIVHRVLPSSFAWKIHQSINVITSCFPGSRLGYARQGMLAAIAIAALSRTPQEYRLGYQRGRGRRCRIKHRGLGLLGIPR